MKTLLEKVNPFTKSPRVVEVEAGSSIQLGPPLFVIGAPRSGTTYINTVLNRHPKVFITNELRFMLFYYEAYTRGTERLGGGPLVEPFLECFRDDIRRQVESYYVRHVTKYKLKTNQRARDLLRRVGPDCVWGDKKLPSTFSNFLFSICEPL